MHEARLAHDALADDSAGDLHVLALIGIKVRLDRLAVRIDIKGGQLKRVFARRSERGELLTAHRKLVCIVRFGHGCLIFCHLRTSFILS